MRVGLTATPVILNTAFFIAGMTLLWFETYNWWAMAYAFLASIHVTFSVQTTKPTEGGSHDDGE